MSARRAAERKGSPIFVVGPDRSGTTLMRAALSRHARVWVVGETHYFDDLRMRFRGRESTPLSKEDAKTCEDYFLALAHKRYGQGRPERARRITRAELQTEAARRGQGTDAYFQAYCEIRARRRAKERWGEKTPRHVFRIGEILGVWPAAKVVCMVRDPRAIASSDRHRKARDERRSEGDARRDARFESEKGPALRFYNVVLISLLWRSAISAALEARARFGADRVRIQPYESILQEPEAQFRELTNWLALEFDDALLDVPVVNSSFDMRGQIGISLEPLERWRTNLPPEDVSVVQTCCGRLMDELGYERVQIAAPLRRIAVTWASAPVAFTRALVVNRRRMGSVPRYVWRRLRLAAPRGSSVHPGR